MNPLIIPGLAGSEHQQGGVMAADGSHLSRKVMSCHATINHQLFKKYMVKSGMVYYVLLL